MKDPVILCLINVGLSSREGMADRRFSHGNTKFARRTSATVYKWRAKYGGMDASLIAEMKTMAEENRRLKRMYADVSMQNDLLKEALRRKRPV